MSERIIYNPDEKFDLQLERALIDERRLGELFSAAKLEKVELKSETWLFERTKNICIEIMRDGKPTGLASTDADVWVHELKRDGKTLCYLLFPINQLKELCRTAYRNGQWRTQAGDHHRQTVVLLRLADILQYLFADALKEEKP